MLNQKLNKLVNEEEFYRNWQYLSFLYFTRILRGKKEGYRMTMKVVHGNYRSR